ncbi:MAG: hypothetical protein ABJC62_10445 [Frankiaceae bacterium]
MPSLSPLVDPTTAGRIERAVSAERFAGYRAECGGDRVAAVELYRWNGELSGAFWETLGHVEVLLRNVLSNRLAARQERLGRPMSWLTDPTVGLDSRGREDITKARRRIHAKRKQPSDGQVISELSLGFWRFLLTRRYQGRLWPDLATGFPHAPTRNRQLVEDPVVRLHEFRNRLAHHQRVWSEPVADRYDDCLLLAGFIDPAVRDWIGASSSVPAVLRSRP